MNKISYEQLRQDLINAYDSAGLERALQIYQITYTSEKVFKYIESWITFLSPEDGSKRTVDPNELHILISTLYQLINSEKN